MNEHNFKKVFYNSALTLFLLGLMVIPLGAIGFYKVNSTQNVLSVQDVRVSEDTAENDVIETSPMLESVLKYSKEHPQATESTQTVLTKTETLSE